MSNSNFSIIIPVFNEEALLEERLKYFQELNLKHEVIFVDGGSADRTYNKLEESGFKSYQTEQASRGAQLLLGAENAQNEILIFHHFDSIPPDNFTDLILTELQEHTWGRFNVLIDDSNFVFRIIELMMNIRSKYSGIVTGDQLMFVKKKIFFDCIEKLEEFPIMEDIYLSKQLKRITAPVCIRNTVKISSRYWRKNGILKSIFMMWQFRLLFYFGVSPKRLYRMYYK